MDYSEYRLCPIPFEPWNEILVASLSDVGFESFMEEENELLAYISTQNEELSLIHSLLSSFSDKKDLELTYVRTNIEHQNWNALWEADFEPVYVDDRLSIVAPFHGVEARRNRVIEIDPKMSFGTGHHQTTFLMCQQILNLVLVDKLVLDMGTGTGVLAILAEQLGAREIIAIDIESWSVENTKWNAERNGCTKIVAIEGGASLIPLVNFDFIFANINKNILKEQLPIYSQVLTEGGTLLLSGFFNSDVAELVAVAEQFNLFSVSVHEKEAWALIQLQKR
jgi:ribosomal protein L11 methyltransferase